MRSAALWLILFAAYAATLGLHAFDDSDYAGDEPHYLLAAESLTDDGDIDVKDEYAARAYDEFYPYDLDVHGDPTNGRLHEPHGVGFPVFIAPAYAIGGAKGVELFLAAIAALAVVLGYRLALRVVPDPWASGAALAVGLSPPFVAYGTAVYPELTAGACLAGAALLALRLEEGISRRAAFGCFVLLGALPWLGTKFVPAGPRDRLLRRAHALAGAAAGAGDRLGGGGAVQRRASTSGSTRASTAGPTPYSADFEGETATDASFPLGYLERSYRLVALFIDREYGLLRWAPVFALAFAGLWLLWRSHRERVARAVPEVRRIEVAAGLCAAALGAQLLVAAFLAPTMFGFWFPPRHLLAGLPLAIPLAAWGLRHLPRVGSALALLSVAGSVWLYFDVPGGGLARRGPPRRAVRAAHRAVPVLRRRRLGVRAGRRDRLRAAWPWRRSRRATGARPRAPRARSTPGSARSCCRWCGGGMRSAPRRGRCRRPRATA